MALTIVMAGCSGGGQPSPTPLTAPSNAASASQPVDAADDPPGTRTCTLLVKAVRDATLMDAGVVNAVVAASRSADAPVADAAQRLAAAYAGAAAARNTDSEPDAVANVSAAGAEMAQTCGDAGLESVG